MSRMNACASKLSRTRFAKSGSRAAKSIGLLSRQVDLSRLELPQDAAKRAR